MFLLNSRYPLLCATRRWLPSDGSRLSRSYASNLPSSFSIVLSSALVCSTSPPVSVSGTVYTLELFPGTIHEPGQSDKPGQHFTFVTSSRPRNVNLVPIDYGFRPRLRGRLTLRGLTLRRNPWTFGDRVSHSVCRYSCQHSHFRYLQRPSRVHLRRLTERSATAQLSVVSRQFSDKCARRPCSMRAISQSSACHARRHGRDESRSRRRRTTAAPRPPNPSPSSHSGGIPHPSLAAARSLHQQGTHRLQRAATDRRYPILLHPGQPRLARCSSSDNRYAR